MTTTRRIAVSLGAWLKATAVNAVVVALLFSLSFALAGVPWWLGFGLLCGVLNAVPILGALLSMAAAAYAGLFASYEGWTGVIITLCIWLAIQFIEGFILSPRAAGKSGVHPLLSIPLVVVAGLLFGPIAAIVAVPVAAVVLIVWRARRRRGT